MLEKFDSKEVMMVACLGCGVEFSDKREGGRGRPKSYCSVACRRAAELEVRRINERLGWLEEQLMRTRLGGDLILTPAADIQAEIDRQGERLRRLLAAREAVEAAG